jgi:hypothetical protein
VTSVVSIAVTAMIAATGTGPSRRPSFLQTERVASAKPSQTGGNGIPCQFGNSHVHVVART